MKVQSFYPQWANADYAKYGFANKLDFLLLGAYASTDAVYGTTEWTMQGFCKLAKDVLKGDVKFAGGPDVGNATGLISLLQIYFFNAKRYTTTSCPGTTTFFIFFVVPSFFFVHKLHRL